MRRNKNKWLKYYENEYKNNGLIFDRKACEGFYLLKYIQD